MAGIGTSGVVRAGSMVKWKRRLCVLSMSRVSSSTKGGVRATEILTTTVYVQNLVCLIVLTAVISVCNILN